MSQSVSPAEVMDGAAAKIQQTFLTEIRGASRAGSQVAAAVVNAAGSIRMTGNSEASSIAALEQEAAELRTQGGFEASRLKLAQAAEKRAAFAKAVATKYAIARSLADHVEAELRLSLTPKLPGDAGRRQLARAEIDVALAGVHGAEIVNAVTRLVGSDPDMSAELLHGYGERRVKREGQNPQQAEVLWRAVLVGSTGKLMESVSTETAKAAGRGLAAIDQLRGSLDATRNAALMKTGIHKGAR